MREIQVATWIHLKPTERSMLLNSYQKVVNPHYEDERQANNKLIMSKWEKLRKASKKQHNQKKGKH